MTLLVASIPVATLDDVRNLSESAFARGADAVELRLDRYSGDWIELANYLQTRGMRKWILTSRPRAPLAATDADPRAAMDLHRKYRIAAVSESICVDFDSALWKTLPQADREYWLSRPPESLILSHHDFVRPPDDLNGIARRLTSSPGRPIAKIAYQPSHIEDSFAALDLIREYGKRIIAVAMGEEGLWTRVLARKLNAFASFSSLTREEATAPGQFTIAEMLGDFRWAEIRSDTRVYGVLGDPVAHSLSPSLFNRWFDQSRINAVYLPLRVRGSETLRAFLNQCRLRPWLDLGGFSVTVPHKVTALDWLGDRADRTANGVGAVNTIVFRDGDVSGYNTDCYAAQQSLVSALNCTPNDLRGIPVDLLGAGGAARAVAAGLLDVGAEITVYVRNPHRALWAANAGCRVFPWDHRCRRNGRVLIHTTPIGMWPAVDETPIPSEHLAGCALVFDLIYNPLKTRLLRDAESAGIRTLNGLDMFIRQAAMQFRLWTGGEPDLDSARDLLVSRLDIHQPDSPPRLNEIKASRSIEDRPIALIGMRGAGKSTVGRLLAAKTHGTFLDTDELVVLHAGRTIAQIFAEEGEAGFRAREADALRMAVGTPPRVLSVGGGAVLMPQNREILRRNFYVIWLTAPADELWRRIAADPHSGPSRPPLTTGDPRAEITRLLENREHLYSEIADLKIDTTGSTPEQLVELILRARVAAT